MKKEPKVSIIVPIYKKEKTLNICVQSILDQDYKNMEIILVNDGSPDKCGVIIDELAKKNDIIKVIHQVNSGVSVARNNGTDFSTGEFICYIDADDRIKKNYISSLVNAMEDDIDIVVSVANANRNKGCYLNREQAIKKMFVDDSFGVCIWAKLFRRQVVPKDVFPTGVKMGEDMYALFRIINNSKKIKMISYRGYLYTENAEVNSFSISEKKDFLYAINLIDTMHSELKNCEKEVEKCLEIGKVRRYLGLLNILFRKELIERDLINSCFLEIKKFSKRYAYCREMPLKFNIRVLAASIFPQIYIKAVKGMMKK